MILSTSDIMLRSIIFVQKGIVVKIPLSKICSLPNTKHVRATLIMFNILAQCQIPVVLNITVGKSFVKVVSKTNKADTQQTCTYCCNWMWRTSLLHSGKKILSPLPAQLPGTDQKKSQGIQPQGTWYSKAAAESSVMQVTAGPRRWKTCAAPAAENPAGGSTQESPINPLIEPFAHSFSRCHLEAYHLPDFLLGAGKHCLGDRTILSQEDFSLVGEKMSRYNLVW